jgi:lysophospholipid acyltransferase (LPLAT)-like uncharacterized protein
VECVPPKDFRPGIIALWHEDLVASTAAFRNRGIHAMISGSRDGSFFSAVVSLLGYQTSQGSTSRGGTSIRHLLSSLKQGHFTAMALDGPRGPARTVKPGTAWLAQKSNCPVWMISAFYQKAFRLSTWDKLFVPLPFSKVRIEIKECYLS